jgi:asparagine synthase (glutamine-hydrolysing)
MTRQHVTVALSGDGADELLAGYETYQANALASLYRRVPAWFHDRWVTPVIQRLPASEGKISLEYKLKRFIAAARLTPERAHCAWRIIFNEEQKRRLLAPAVAHEVLNWDTFELCRAYFGPDRGLNQFLSFDIGFYLPSDMLTKIDRMSMAHALEVRVPFLDHKVVEFIASLPPKLKLRRFWTKKYLLKRVMRGRLPREIIHRPKAGFNVPLNRWFKHELREYVRDVLSRETICRQGFFRPEEVELLLDQHQRGQVDWSYQIYSLLIFTLWARLFLESSEFSSAPHTGG